MSRTSHDKPLSTEEQKNLICGILADFAADPDVEVLFDYLSHCRLPLSALHSAGDIVPAFLALYRTRPGVYDVDRAFGDLRWWSPIAARIKELETEAQRRKKSKLKRRK